MPFDGLPDEWVVWTDEEEGRSVLVYRPDVFDTQSYPPECLPTIYLTGQHPDRPAGERQRGPEQWYVLLYLEPDVRARDVEASYDARTEAVAGAVEVATAFARGEIDYRDLYQVPREEYFEELDELTGRDA